MGLVTSTTTGDGHKQITVGDVTNTQWEWKRGWVGSSKLAQESGGNFIIRRWHLSCD